ncbi:MAG: C39 family peptidase [Candidatus Nanohaloarchaea archaeon]
MAGLLNSLLNFVLQENTTVRLLVTLFILVAGHLSVKVTSLVLRRISLARESATKKDVTRKEERIQYASYLMDAGVIAMALFYLNSALTEQLYLRVTEFIPRLLSVFLIGILGVITINVFAKVTLDFLNTIGIKNYFREAGLSSQAFNLISGIIKAFLYLILLQIMLDQLGIGQTIINQLINASSWAIAFLVAGLLFYGFKDLFQNFAAGIYLKNSRMVRPGEEVNIQDEPGEIREVTMFSTAVDTNSGYTLLTPNREIMKSSIKLKRTKSDLETLEDITSYFVAQHPAYCGPASMEMALEIFGYRYSQDEIGDAAGTTEEEGTEVEGLMESVEELTNNDVRAAFVEYDKVSDLGDEFKAWFNDGALIVPNFYKPEIFPDANAGHFVLAVGVEGNEILVMDPSGTKGGVYYIDKERLLDAMAEFDHSRGYIVAAPKGTTAYWRIKNDLIYADKNYYDELSKTLEARLRKILRQGRILKDAMPSSMNKYVEEWRGNDKITRVWHPEGEEEDEG